jgi:hypothetical protein
MQELYAATGSGKKLPQGPVPMVNIKFSEYFG